MKIEGNFNDADNLHTYGVTVENSDSNGVERYTVGDGHVWFGDTPVVIETSCENTETVIIETKATVNLVTDAFLGGLFAKSATDTRVLVTCDGLPLFDGYVEPRVYTQAYSDETNDLSLNCLGGLSMLRYSPFRGVTNNGMYMQAMKASRLTSLKSLLVEGISVGCGSKPIWYDGSKQTVSGGLLLDDLMVNESLYLGSSYSDVKTWHDVVSDLLLYLGLHAIETPHGVYVFSRESIGKPLDRVLLSGNAVNGAPFHWDGGEITADHLGGLDSSIDIGEVFNQISLTVSPETSSTVLRSPLDSTGTLPIMGAPVTYMTEYAADGEGQSAANAFWDLVKNHHDNHYDAMVWIDFMLRPMRNIYWSIGRGSGPGSSATDFASLSNPDPWTLIDRLRTGLGAMLMSAGTVDHKPGTGDNSPQPTVSMTTHLIISVNGNGSDTTPFPTDTDIQSAMPVASYRNGDTLAVYSPGDARIKNYLVISGNLTLNPLMETNFDITRVRKYGSGDDFFRNYAYDLLGIPVSTKSLVGRSPSRGNPDGRYLAFEWWKDGAAVATRKGWMPYTGDGPEQYEYKTATGDDTLMKFDVLWCMLRIGSKVLVEDKSKQGGLDAFEWRDYQSLSDLGGDVDQYLTQTFTIGINPKIGDKVIGQEYSIGTNFDYTTQIKADGGMAIPLPYAKHLHGELSLDILGVDNGPWENYHKIRHATMFRHSQWSTDRIPLMAHVGHVQLSQFSVRFFSDGNDSGDDSDIAYVSHADAGYTNKKEVDGSKIHSGFTEAEVNTYNLNDMIVRSTVCDSSGAAVLAIKDANRGEVAKPEALYVDALWQRLHIPRLTLTQTLRPCLLSPWGVYEVPMLGKSMMMLEGKSDLASGTCKAKLTELGT